MSVRDTMSVNDYIKNDDIEFWTSFQVAGDVIFTGGKDTGSKLTQLAETALTKKQSNFSHVRLVHSPGLYIDSMPNVGVNFSKAGMPETDLRSYKHYKVFRHTKMVANLSGDRQREFDHKTFSERLLYAFGQKYNYAFMFKSELGVPENEYAFCSEFVAKILRETGLDELGNFSSQNIYPSMLAYELESSINWSDVTDSYKEYLCGDRHIVSAEDNIKKMRTLLPDLGKEVPGWELALEKQDDRDEIIQMYSLLFHSIKNSLQVAESLQQISASMRSIESEFSETVQEFTDTELLTAISKIDMTGIILTYLTPLLSEGPEGPEGPEEPLTFHHLAEKIPLPNNYKFDAESSWTKYVFEQSIKWLKAICSVQEENLSDQQKKSLKLIFNKAFSGQSRLKPEQIDLLSNSLCSADQVKVEMAKVFADYVISLDRAEAVVKGF